jgi:uncharacterized protein (DUF1697 family)
MNEMSGRHVALLRGINVGKAKRVAMADLRALVESLGYGEVRTLLNSGNVVFSAPARLRGDHAARIEKAIAAKIGLTSKVIVLSAEEVAALHEENTLAGWADDFTRLLVFALAEPQDVRHLEELARQRWSQGAIVLGRRAAFVWCPDGLLDSPIATAVGKALRDRTTSRNWATMLKLDAMLLQALSRLLRTRHSVGVVGPIDAGQVVEGDADAPAVR